MSRSMYYNFDLNIFFSRFKSCKNNFMAAEKKPPDIWLISQRNDLCCKSKKQNEKKRSHCMANYKHIYNGGK